MVGILLHVLYLFGKCIYDRYRFRKPIFLPDISDEERSEQDYDSFDDDSELEMEMDKWHDKKINKAFYPPAYLQRYEAVWNVLQQYKGKMYKIVDFGCAELGFLRHLKSIKEVQQILCVDVDKDILERHQKKAAPLISEMLYVNDRMLTIEICEGSVTDNDIKLKNANAVICIELIEHLYPDTLTDLPFNIFGFIKPDVVIITTPNVEFNILFSNFSGFRHPDHKFEWTRKQFQDWAQNIVERYPYYRVEFHGICNGPTGTEELGALTQMAVFHRILPRDQSMLESLVLDEYNQLKGREGLFNTIAIHNYQLATDTRSDEQKILDEAVCCINHLSCNSHPLNEDDPPWNSEISLARIMHYMTKYSGTEETLKSILMRGGWSVVDREDGPVVLNPSEPSDEMSEDFDDIEDMDNEYENSRNEDFEDQYWDYVTESPINEIPADVNEEEYLPERDSRTNNWHEERNVTDGRNVTDEERWNYVTNPHVVEENEENLSQQGPHNESWHSDSNFTDENQWDYVPHEIFASRNEEHSSAQNLHIENWHEEPSIIIPENYSVNEEASVIFANRDEEYLSAQNSHIETCDEESSIIIPENHSINEEASEIFASRDEEYSSVQNSHIENWHEEPNIIIPENHSVNEEASEIFASRDEEYSSVQNSHIENWHEEPSIIIPENYSINQENTYLFDGENSLIEESPSKEPCATYDDINHSEVRSTTQSLMYTERELPSDSVSLVLRGFEIEELEKAKLIASNMSTTLNSLQGKLENSVDNIESAVLQNDQINIRTSEDTSTINLQSHMPISRSSTSPASLSLSFEINNSSQDFNTYYQNEFSINNQCFLNSTFCQSKIATEATMNTEESTVRDIPCLPVRDMQESELNLSLHISSNHYNCDVEQERDISDKNQICEDSSMADEMSSDAYSNLSTKPKYTSSPRTKISATNVKSLKHRKQIPTMNSNVSLGTIEKIEEIVSDTSSNLLEPNQKSNNSVTETVKLYTTSSSSDITNTSEYDIGFSATNSTQQKLSLENKKFSNVNTSISTELIQNTHESAENNIINRDSEIVDIQNIDVQDILSLDSENIDHKDENVYCTLAKTDHTDTKAHLENITNDHTQSNRRKKGLNPPKELLSSKSQNISKCSSSDCAKEISILKNNRVLPCKSSEDTSNVHFTLQLKSEESVGTSKDASSITGLINNVEAKPSSPLETPPNSWSPEIMDSGYPNSASAQDITPEYDLSSIAQDHISDSESPSVAEAPRLGVLEPIEVENGDLANNNRDDEGNNMMAIDANDIENLQPLIDVLENDLENENDIYVVQNGFPVWLLRILDMANPLDFDMQAQQNLRIPAELADDANYAGHDEGFDSSSSESESDIQ